MKYPNPLAAYDGARPPAPDWFLSAIETPYASRSVEVDGARIHYQQWGKADNPSLLLVHGNGAHAHWYDFIAPAFSDDFNVVAINFSGMGDSDWRGHYSLEQFSAEQMGVMHDAGLFDHETKPIIAAHSLGGIITLVTALEHGASLKLVAIMDTPVHPPEEALSQGKPPPTKTTFFPDKPSALARFRLRPEQDCENHFILDHIARHSLKQTTHQGERGWTWKFDPAIWGSLDWPGEQIWDAMRTSPCELAFMRGAQSSLLTEVVRDRMLAHKQASFVTIEGAGHHLFLDRPLETIAALKDFFAQW